MPSLPNPNSASDSASRVTIAVDAMGGDFAPHAVVAGTAAAARALPDLDIALVGDEAVVAPLLRAAGPPLANLTLCHASQVVEMCDAPGAAVRQKRESSIAVGMRLVREGRAQAIISAGNSGAMMAAAVLILKAQRGVDRPAIATLLPTQRGHVVLLDSGATTDCKPAHLVQFARLGNIYASTVLDCASPRVGLLSIGEEPTKGDELTKETHQLLLASELIFIGNVEPKELVRGEVDVVVCDGFVGNLMLKAGEGFCGLIMTLIAEEVAKRPLFRLAERVLRPAFRQVTKRFDYAEVGGALLLGVNGVVVICHGRSNGLAIGNAVRLAARAARRHLADTLIAPSPSNLVTPGSA